jgi:hypothetical protein
MCVKKEGCNWIAKRYIIYKYGVLIPTNKYKPDIIKFLTKKLSKKELNKLNGRQFKLKNPQLWTGIAWFIKEKSKKIRNLRKNKIRKTRKL